MREKRAKVDTLLRRPRAASGGREGRDDKHPETKQWRGKPRHQASGAGRIRTPDFWFWRPAFYQLNYCPGERQF
jgi:hypothetical protein